MRRLILNSLAVLVIGGGGGWLLLTPGTVEAAREYCCHGPTCDCCGDNYAGCGQDGCHCG